VRPVDAYVFAILDKLRPASTRRTRQRAPRVLPFGPPTVYAVSATLRIQQTG